MRSALVVLGGLALAAGAGVGGYVFLKSDAETKIAARVDEAIAPSCGRYERVSVEPITKQVRIDGLVLECFRGPETTFEAERVSVLGADAAAINTVLDVENAPDDPLYEFLPILDNITLAAVSITAPDGRFELSQLSLDGLAMRRYPRPPVMSDGSDPYTAEDLINLLGYHTQFARLEADGLQSENAVSGETAGAESLTLERFEAGTADIIEVVGLYATIANNQLSAAHADLLLLSDFDAGGFVQAMVSEAQAGDAPYIAPHEPPSPTVGNTLLEGVELELAAGVALIDQLKFSDLEYVGSIAVGGRVEMQGFEVELSQERTAFLRKLGYRRFVLNLKYLSDYNDEAKTWVLEDFRAAAVDMGRLELAAKFIDIHLAPRQERVALGAGLSGQLMTAVIDRTALESARIAYTDEGFVRKFVEVGAAETGLSEEEFVSGLIKDFGTLMQGLEITADPFEFAFADLERFLKNPGTIEILVKPEFPASVVEVPKQFFFAPASAIEAMGLEIRVTEG